MAQMSICVPRCKGLTALREVDSLQGKGKGRERGTGVPGVSALGFLSPVCRGLIGPVEKG